MPPPPSAMLSMFLGCSGRDPIPKCLTEVDIGALGCRLAKGDTLIYTTDSYPLQSIYDVIYPQNAWEEIA